MMLWVGLVRMQAVMCGVFVAARERMEERGRSERIFLEGGDREVGEGVLGPMAGVGGIVGVGYIGWVC